MKTLWIATIIDTADFGRTLWQGYSLSSDRLVDIAADEHIRIMEKMQPQWREYVKVRFRHETLL